MIYIYGDSFSEPFDLPTWPSVLGRNLAQDVMNYGSPGSSWPHIWSWMHNTCDQWQPDDQIIVTLSSVFRTWFWRDQPHVSGAHVINIEQLVDAKDRLKIRAMQQYYQYLEQEHLLIEGTVNRLGWLSARSRITGRDVLLLRCFDDFSYDFMLNMAKPFDNLTVFRGCLTDDVSRPEVSPDLGDSVFACDPRANHMIISNHEILADLLTAVIRARAEPDLTQAPWHRGVVTEQRLLDTQWAQAEILTDRLADLWQYLATNKPR